MRRRLIRPTGTKKSSPPKKAYDPFNDERFIQLLINIRSKLTNSNIYNSIVPNNSALKSKVGTKSKGKDGRNWIVKVAPNSKVVRVVYPKMKVSKNASLPKMWYLNGNNNKATLTKKHIKKVKTISKMPISAVNSENRNLRSKTNLLLYNQAIKKGETSSDIIKSFFRKKYAKK